MDNVKFVLAEAVVYRCPIKKTALENFTIFLENNFVGTSFKKLFVKTQNHNYSCPLLIPKLHNEVLHWFNSCF